MALTTHTASNHATDQLGYTALPALLRRMRGDEKHDWASESTLDVIWTLYDRVLRVDPLDPDNPDRDRFYLSKGHGPMAYYAVLTAKGFIDPSMLDGFAGPDSILGHHPDRRLVPGVEISSGSLGQGLALGIGATTALTLSRSSGRVFVLIGDGELDEGSNHEAIAYAARAELDALNVVVVDNESATHGWPGGVGRRFEVEGWSVAIVDGRDHDAMESAFTARHPGRPRAVIAQIGGGR